MHVAVTQPPAGVHNASSLGPQDPVVQTTAVCGQPCTGLRAKAYATVATYGLADAVAAALGISR